MKRLLLSALLVLLAAALHAQEFYRITDIDDDERALEVSAVSYLDASENRFGAQVAYEIKPLTAYFEVSFFSEHLGEEYGGIKYKAPSFRVGMDYGFFEYGMLTLFTGAYIGITPYSTEYLERDKNAYVSSKRLVKVTENGFIAGLKLGARLDFLDRVFVKAAVLPTPPTGIVPSAAAWPRAPAVPWTPEPMWRLACGSENLRFFSVWN